MKRILFSIAIMVSILTAVAQVTLTLQPDGCLGKDAEISDNNATTNYGANNSFFADRWTCGGNPCTGRSLIQFDLSSIPQGSTINSATLSLYANLNAGAGSVGNPTFGTDNACYLKKVIAAWSEMSVVWNNQPTADTTSQVLLPQSTSTAQDYPNIDITAFAQYWSQNPAENYGMMIEIITANSLNSLVFCSSDHADSTKRPKLIITYTPPLNACFTLQPDGCLGKDAEISDNNATTNYGANNSFFADRWTCGGNPCSGRSVIQFDLSSIPQGAIITSASLSLYANLNAGAGSVGNPTFGTDNACYLKRVTAPWSEMSVVWNNQPTTDTTDQVLLPQSTSTAQDYPNINITAFAQYWSQNPAENYGMMIEIIAANSLNSLVFCSSDHADSTKRPKLEVCYSIPTSIRQLSSAFSLKIYPNPANNELNMNLGGLQADRVSIYNIDGKLVSETNQPVNNRIDISSLAAGVYVAEVKLGDVSAKRRWVKM